jgi:hypothetical protein
MRDVMVSSSLSALWIVGGWVNRLAGVGEIVQRGEQALESLSKCHQTRVGLGALEHGSLGNAVELGELPLECSASTSRIEVAESLLVVDHASPPLACARIRRPKIAEKTSGVQR